MSKNSMRSSKSFTLSELMLVVIIIGVLALLVIPTFQRTVDESYARRMITDMQSIAAAQRVFEARFGECYPITGIAWTDEINRSISDGGLGSVNLLREDRVINYRCRPIGTRCQCEGQYSNRHRLPQNGAWGVNPTWEMMMRSNSVPPWRLDCVDGVCPGL